MGLICTPSGKMKPPLGTPLNRMHPLSRDLAGCWLLNEGSGTLATDTSLYWADGTLINGPTWENQSVLFDNANSQYIECGDKKHLDGMSQLTVYARGRIAIDAVAGSYCLASKYDDHFAQKGTYTLNYRIDSDTRYYRINWILYLTDSTYFVLVSSWIYDPLHRGKWFTAVGVTDGFNAYIYKDGLLFAGPQARAGGIQTSTTNFRIGAYSDNTRYFDGQISEVYVWRRALTASEIRSLHVDPYQIFRREPIELWTVGQVAGGNDYSVTINDGIGVADDPSQLAAMIRGLSEAIGISDTTTRVAAVIRVLSEAIGMADTAVRAATMLRAITESLGITDSVITSTAAHLVETINEAVGLTDVQSKLSILVRTVADGMGMGDVATRLAVLLRTITDAEGITDGQTLGRMMTLADDLGVSDEMARIVAYLRTQSDGVGLTDAAAKVHAAVRAIADTEGMSDSYSTAWTILRTISETLGLTDEMVQEGTGTLVRVINDVVGMVDARSKAHAALRALTATIGTTDSVLRLFAASRVISDVEGITDGAYLGKVFTIAESIGIGDEVSRLVSFLRTEEEGIGIIDAIVRVATVLRTLDDSIQLTDVEKHGIGGLVQAAIAFLLLKKGR